VSIARPVDGTAVSSGGIPIHYRFVDAGDLAIVFVHGWGDTMALWAPHMAAVSPPHGVVLLDLSGHGRSGKGRTAWTIEAFADDVCAVCDELGVKRAVLVGHSMGGPIILEVALRVPGRIVGLVPIDIIVDVDHVRSADERAAFFRYMREDFKGAVSSLVVSLFPPNPDKASMDRIIAMEMANDKAMMVPALESAMAYDVRAALSRIRVPIFAINASLSPTSIEHNREYAPQYDAVVMSSVSHWLMRDRPEEFDANMVKALDHIGGARHVGGF
jgi:pimeloyl-ACP methyl ester carboxylesterase